MHANLCVLIETSMEKGMLNFWLGLLVTALTKETYFSKKQLFVFLPQLQVWIQALKLHICNIRYAGSSFDADSSLLIKKWMG